MDAVLWSVLSLGLVSSPPARESGFGPLGDTKVQEAEAPHSAGHVLAWRGRSTRTTTVYTLATSMAYGEIGEPDELRGSRPVLGEPRGGNPRGYSLCAAKANGLLAGRSRTAPRDEGRPLEIALQEEVSNHRQRLGTKALVVSVTEKAELDSAR